jgi:hypothetical protein
MWRRGSLDVKRKTNDKSRVMKIFKLFLIGNEKIATAFFYQLIRPPREQSAATFHRVTLSPLSHIISLHRIRTRVLGRMSFKVL